MATDLLGKEKVENYIKKSGKKDFNIRRGGDKNSVSIFESRNSTAKDAADSFTDWADIFYQDGTNSIVYDIVLFDNDTDKEKNKAFKASFQLAEQAVRRNSNGTEVIIQHPSSVGKNDDGRLDKSTVEMMINAAVEKVQSKNDLKSLREEIAELRSELDEEEEPEEEEEEEEEEENIIPESWTSEKVKDLISFAKNAYVEAKGAGTNLTPGESRRVAGPPQETDFAEHKTHQEKKSAGEEIPVMEKELLPAFNHPPDHNDQLKKINLAIPRIYKFDGHIGDDLLLVAEMAEKNYDKFKGVILSLREGDKKL